MFTCLYSHAYAFGQQVTLDIKNEKLAVILSAIERQTEYTFIYKKPDLKSLPPISVTLKEVSVTHALGEILRHTNLGYEVFEKTVVLKQLEVQKKIDFPLTATTALHTSKVHMNVSLQKFPLQGVVLNEKDKPFPGVIVSVVMDNGDVYRSQSDKRGEFVFKDLLQPDVLKDLQVTFKFIGYQELKRNIKSDFVGFLTVKLVPEDQQVEEVVVTGYADVKRETFTGAATTITREMLRKFNNNNIFSILQTLDPAFKIDQGVETGSNPNVIPEINIRGIASVGDHRVNAPLVVIDGFESSLQALYDLDINRIESITILKDASSTSLYGSRGSNGVLAIETRLPKDGRFTISYDARPSTTLVDLSDYNMMNAAEKLAYERLVGVYDAPEDNFTPNTQFMSQEALDNLYASRLNNVLSGVETYWMYQPIQSTTSVNHSLRMEGGANEVRYSLTGNYNDFKGVVKESGRVQGSGSFNLNYRLRDKLIFSNIASYQYVKAYNSPYGDFAQYVSMNPYERIYDADGNYTIQLSGDVGVPGGGGFAYNPLYNTTLGFRDDSRSHAIANNMSLEWFIIPGLRLRARGMLSREMTDSDTYTSPYHTQFIRETDKTKKGSYILVNSSGTQFSGNLSLDYSKNFGKHVFNTNVMGELRSSRSTSNRYEVTGFNDDRFVSPSIALQYAANTLPVTTDNPRNAIGLLGSLFYTFNNSYVLSGTVRSDGSSLFGSAHRFGMFWSTGFAYNVHREAWFKNKYVDWLRIRANYGTNGSENFNSDMLNTGYRFIAGNYYYNQYAATYNNQGNSGVKWPVMNQLSIGAEIGVLKDLVSVSLSYYDKTMNDMISKVTVAPSFGFNKNSFVQNLGKVNNRGFEFNTNFRLIQDIARDFSWYLAVGGANNRGRLMKISNELREMNESLVVKDDNGQIIKPSVYYEEGQSLSVIRGVPSLGIDPASGREMFLDREGNITYNWDANDQTVIGNSEAKVYGNLSMTFNFRRLSLQLGSNYSIGGDVYNQTLVNKVENNQPLLNADRRVLQERWKEPGDKALYKGIRDQTTTQVSSRFLQKENFLRLTNININYDFSMNLLSKYKVQRMRVNFSTNDMYRFSNVRMERGLSYPYARTYNFGLMVDL